MSIDVNATACVAAEAHLEARALLSVKFAEIPVVRDEALEIERESYSVGAPRASFRAFVELWISISGDDFSAGYHLLIHERSDEF